MGVQGGGTEAAGVDRSVPPEVGEAPAVTLPAMVRFTLPGDLEVVVVERPGLPLVHLEMLVRGGARVQEGRAGLAELTLDLLDEGTTSRSALDIAVAAEGMGARLSTGASWDHSSVSLSVLKPRLEEGVELLADVLMNPSFAPAELERVRAERINRVLQAMDDPAILADDTFGRVLYGESHPYGAPLLGTGASLRALTREDVEDHYRRAFRGGPATLLVLGEVTRDEVEPLLVEAMAGWGAPGSAPAARTAVAAGGEGAGGARGGVTIHVVDRPGAPQSEIRVGRITVERGHPDEHVLVVLNTVLGGSFTSRLMQNLREEKGFTYGAGSSFRLRGEPGPFVALSAVHTPVTAPAVLEFVREIRRMADEPVPDAELERARNYVSLRLPQRFEALEDVAARVGELVLYGLPPDWWEGYVDAIRAVTAEGVRRVAAEQLASGGLTVVVVGDGAVIEEPLRALGLGPVVLLPAQAGGN
jgi:zinc protease